MDRRISYTAFLALIVGLGVMVAEGYVAGLLATQTGLMPHGITLGEIEWRGLYRSVLFIWGLPSALGALLIACIKPRRWALYSLCAVLPHFGQFVAGAMSAISYHISVGYLLFSGALNLALLPLFLWLYYALIHRHTTG